MDVRTALLQGTKLLEDAEVGVARLTAEVLLAHALRRDRSYLFGHPEHELSELEWLHYGRYLHERMQGKPTQYITGHQEFYGRDFRVTPDALIPRPETEHVVETVLRLTPRVGRMLDVGCGSGILAVTLRLETGADVWATDISQAAIGVAAGNAQRLEAPVSFVACDLMSAIAGESMDLIVSNPPYVPLGDKAGLQREVRDWEPHVAAIPVWSFMRASWAMRRGCCGRADGWSWSWDSAPAVGWRRCSPAGGRGWRLRRTWRAFLG